MKMANEKKTKKYSSRCLKNPHLPPYQRPVPLNQVQFNKLVHVLRIRPQCDGRFVLGTAAVKIGFPQLAGIDFAALFHELQKEAVMRRKLLKKACLLVYRSGALTFLDVIPFDRIAFIGIGAKGRILEELKRAPGVSFGERGYFLEGRHVPYLGQKREFRTESDDICQVLGGISGKVYALRIQPRFDSVVHGKKDVGRIADDHQSDVPDAAQVVNYRVSLGSGRLVNLIEDYYEGLRAYGVPQTLQLV